MTTQDAILRACTHKTAATCEVNMGRGERLFVCCSCWNASVAARRQDRKAQLADHWAKYREAQTAAMREAGAAVGDRVGYFCRSMLGLGSYTVTGTITLNRNRIAVIRLDRKYDGKRYTEWSKGWQVQQKGKDNASNLFAGR